MDIVVKKNTLYLECYSGISGDMTVAALIDLGADQEILLNGLNSLRVDGYKISISRKIKSSIDACDFDVILDYHDPLIEEPHDTLDHNQPIIDSQNNVTSLKPLKLGHHEHRNLYDINAIIDNSDISSNAKEIAKKIFYIAAIAEAKAHGKTIDKVYFHEVGAIDSIVDIVSTAICLDNLNIGDVIVKELYDGTGHIKCRHGMLPVPVPAVVNIVSDYNIPLCITSINGELVTPTGAAIVAAIRTKNTLPKEFRIKKIGLGAGKREYEQASILRAMLIDTECI